MAFFGNSADEATPSRRGFLRTAGAVAAAPLTQTNALPNIKPPGLSVSKVFVNQEGASNVLSMLAAVRKMSLAMTGSIPEYPVNALKTLEALGELPQSDHYGRGYSALNETTFQTLGMKTIGELFSPEMRFALYNASDWTLDKHSIARLPHANLLVDDPVAAFSALLKHEKLHPIPALRQFANLLADAGIPLDTPVPQAIAMLRREEVKFLIKGLNNLAASAPEELATTIRDVYSSYSDKNADTYAEKARYILEKLEGSLDPGNPALATLRSIVDDSVTVLDKQLKAFEQEPLLPELDPLPEDMRIFLVKSDSMGIKKFRNFLEGQGVPPEELSADNCIISPDYIAVKRGSRAENVIHAIITARHPVLPEGWEPAQAQPHVTDMEIKGTVSKQAPNAERSVTL